MKLISDRIVFTASLLLAMGLVFSGCATSSSDPEFTSAAAAAQAIAPVNPTPTNNPGNNPGGVRFQVGDLVLVAFADTVTQMQSHEERVKEDGNITLQMIGAVQAKDRTAGELQKAIHEAYVPKYFVRLTVTVTHQPAEQVYYVGGEVRVPGPKTYLSGTTLTKAIQTAGGLNDFARKSNILLTRANGTKIKVDWKKASQDPRFDPQISPGDNILVSRRLW